MKKYLLMIVCFLTILMASCNQSNIKITNMNYVNGEYHLSVNEEEINLKNYIISDNEFFVTYLDKQYSSNDDLIFKLQNGNNKFNTEFIIFFSFVYFIFL